MRIRSQLRFLSVYSALATAAFAATAYLGFVRTVHGAQGSEQFDRITVHRIDVVEPNGRPRLIISDKAEFPGEFFDGKEVSRPDRADSAGMLFMNDEGTEDGGLIYGGSAADGKPSSFSHLSFDQYDQDQTVDLGTEFDTGAKSSGLVLNDMPDRPLTPALLKEAAQIKQMPHGSARGAAWANFQKSYPAGTERAALERNDDGSVALALKDKQGRNRLILHVGPDGNPLIEFLDEHGRVLRKLSVQP